MSASISSVFSLASSMTSTRASRCGSVCSRSSSRMRRWPWTMARIVPSWSRITWAILASVPTGYSSSTLVISSCSLERWVTSATGWEVRTARSSALTLRSRPTWSGTIISGKITVSRSATSGRTWTRSRSSPFPRRRMPRCRGCRESWVRQLPRGVAPSAEGSRRSSGSSCVLGESLDIVLIEQIVDPDLAECLELKDDPHAGEVDSLPAGEETNDTNALDVRLAVETEIVSALRGEEAFLLVDPQGAGMAARQLGGDADDVSRAGEIVAARADRVWRRCAPRSVHVRDHKP